MRKKERKGEGKEKGRKEKWNDKESERKRKGVFWKWYKHELINVLNKNLTQFWTC